MIYWLLYLVAGLITLLVAITIVGFLVGWANVWQWTMGPADLGPVKFEGLSKTRRPNQVIICPPDLCNPKHVDAESQVYSVSADQLRTTLLDEILAKSHNQRVDDDTDPHHLRFVTRSKWFQFPDTTRIQLIPLGDSRSTLAIYGQSQVGRKDFGVNRMRVERWLGYLKEFEEG